MRINWKKFNREVHFWGASLCAVPLMIVIITGLLLIVRKDFHWIQPATMNGTGNIPKITFERIIDTAKTVKEAPVTWSQVQTKYNAMMVLYNNNSYARKRIVDYAPVKEQLDKLFHDIDQGKLDKTGSFYTHIKKVKDDAPKE